jgi:hypothetical protein
MAIPSTTANTQEIFLAHQTIGSEMNPKDTMAVRLLPVQDIRSNSMSRPACQAAPCPRRYLRMAAFLTAVCLCLPLCAQDTVKSVLTEGASLPANSVPDAQFVPLSIREKWNHFLHETASPLTLGGGTFNAAFSQVTDTDPKYGVNRVAFAKRIGASTADIASQNFFGDFVVASALREDPRYFPKGKGHTFLSRVGYAISRAGVIRKDSGGNTFNFDNVVGSALSTGFSNLYYPRVSRTTRGMLMHFGVGAADNGFINLVPEFWPDFRDKVLRRHH